MFCAECGTEVYDHAIICPKCGVAVPNAQEKNHAEPKIPNYMVAAILSTIFCCQIGGIVAVVYSAKVNTKLAQGDTDGARAASRTALYWIIGNTAFMVLFWFVYLLIVVVIALAENS